MIFSSVRAAVAVMGEALVSEVAGSAADIFAGALLFVDDATTGTVVSLLACCVGGATIVGVVVAAVVVAVDATIFVGVGVLITETFSTCFG